MEKTGKRLRIGVFDSGFGGLTVLAACARLLPEARFYYFGDNGRAPYGSRPPAEISAFVREALLGFRERGVRLAVLACNTATAVCAEEMRGLFPFPLVGAEPAVKPAAEHASRVLVLATPRTAESGRLARLISRYPACTFTVHAAEGLAAAIEAHFARGISFRLGDFLPAGEYGAVVLGCTHYCFFRREISAFYRAPVFDGNEGIARRVRSLALSPALSAPVDAEWKEKTEKNKSLIPKWSEHVFRNVVFLGNFGALNAKIYKRTFNSAFFCPKIVSSKP